MGEGKTKWKKSQIKQQTALTWWQFFDGNSVCSQYDDKRRGARSEQTVQS